MAWRDSYTGRELDRPAELHEVNGSRCDTCGAQIIDKCSYCGAPQCCPECCFEKSRRRRMKRKQTGSEISISPEMVADAGNDVEKAIIDACTEGDYYASGNDGPTFHGSGPGAGWSRECNSTDFAQYALSNGAEYYLDASDGRSAWLNNKGEVVWGHRCHVDFDTITDEDRELYPEACEAIEEAKDRYVEGKEEE